MSIRDEIIHTERYRCVDNSGEEPIYQKQSEWTSSEDVYMNNGKSLEQEMKCMSKKEDVEQLAVFHDIANDKDDSYSTTTDYFYGIDVSFQDGVGVVKLNKYTDSIADTHLEKMVYASAQYCGGDRSIVICNCWVLNLDYSIHLLAYDIGANERFTGNASINLMVVFKDEIISTE